MQINLTSQQRNSDKFQLDSSTCGVLIGNGTIESNTFKVNEPYIKLQATYADFTATTQGTGKFYYEHLSTSLWGFGVHDPGTGDALEWWSSSWIMNLRSDNGINLNSSAINFGNITPGTVTLYSTNFTVASSGGVAIANSTAGNLDLTNNNASGLTRLCAQSDLELQMFANTWGLGYNLGGSGKLELVSTANDLYIESPNTYVMGDVSLTLETVNDRSDIVLAPNRNTTTAKDFIISDTSKGVVMTARWTDSGHTTPGEKTFRIYVEDDLGTVSAEEI